MMKGYIIKNATLVNEGKTSEASVVVCGQFIKRILAPTEPIPDGYEVIDAKGKYLIPGVIDEHVHFREPGLTPKADIASESRAAVAGGVTSFMDMPNTKPQTTTITDLKQKRQIAAESSVANYSFYLGATADNLSEIEKADPKTTCGIKLFMGSSTGNMLVDDDEVLLNIFKAAPCLVAAHCEDEAIIRQNTAYYKSLVEQGKMEANSLLHPLIRTAEACYRSSARAAELADKAGAHLHLMHVSTEKELQLLDKIKPLSQKRLTAETCPHYLWFDDSDYTTKGFAIKCNPAIKADSDRIAILDALRNGTIDTIGTDHAPHAQNEKFGNDYFSTPSGFPSIQHSLPLMLELGLPIELIVEKMCHAPATLYQIDRRGYIREGYFADLVIIDPKAEQTINNNKVLYKCGWTPYNGQKLHNSVIHTFVNGQLAFENGTVHDVHGMQLQFNR